MAYRNKTYVAFAGEDLRYYNMMKAWCDNEHIEFDFLDAHDINTALDTSQVDTIKRRLRERLANTKQAVLLVSDNAKAKYSNSSFLRYELDVLAELGLSVVLANLSGARSTPLSMVPPQLASPYYLMGVSYRPLIIKYALDNYADEFFASSRTRLYYYSDSVYENLGLS